MSHSQSGDRPGGDHDRVRVDKIYFYSISSHFILLCGNHRVIQNPAPGIF